MCVWVSFRTPDTQQSVTDGTQPDDLDSELVPDPEEMDLLGEIFDSLSLRSSHDRGLIYATRSLDLFGPDTTDFITRVEYLKRGGPECITCDETPTRKRV